MITEDLDRKCFAVINLNWKYAKYHAQCTCCLSMDGYINNLLLKFGHKDPNNLNFLRTVTATLFTTPSSS